MNPWFSVVETECRPQCEDMFLMHPGFGPGFLNQGTAALSGKVVIGMIHSVIAERCFKDVFQTPSMGEIGWQD